MKSDFLNSDIDQNIWEQIKKRGPKPDITIAIFVAHMKILLNRLSRPLVESLKIKNLRKKLLSEYIIH